MVNLPVVMSEVSAITTVPRRVGLSLVLFRWPTLRRVLTYWVASLPIMLTTSSIQIRSELLQLNTSSVFFVLIYRGKSHPFES